MDLGFIKSFGKTKAEGLVNSAVEALVRFDPKGASEAQLAQMDEALSKLGREVVAARRTHDGEARVLKEARDLEAARMTAAETLMRQSDEAGGDAERKAKVEASLATLLGVIERERPGIEEHDRAAADAKRFLDELQGYYDDAAAKLKGARADLERAKRELDRSTHERQQAEQREQKTKELAGLSSSTSSIGVALGAMQGAAQANRDAAEAARMKSDALRPSKPEEEDPLIKAAMAGASGAPSAARSPRERLEALRAKAA